MNNQKTENEAQPTIQVQQIVRQKRQLVDRIEAYDSETFGHCKCGMPVMRVNGSDQTNYTDKTRYYYLDEDKTAWNIFSCKNCHSPIMDNFIPA